MGWSEGQQSLTASDEVLGTPRYMSPEQARARKVPIDHRTDIFSLGATLYEVLTSRPPFQGRTAEETLTQIIQRDPRSPRQLNPRVPRDLETIVLKCLRKEAAERYGTAEALAQDLHRFARGDPVEARPQSLGEKVARRIRHNKAKVAVALALLLVLLTIASLLHDRAAELHRRLVAEYDKAIVDALVSLQTGGALAEQAERFVLSGIGFDLTLVTGDLGFGKVDRIRTAIRTLERCRAAVPERPEAKYLLARGLLLLGDEDRALRELSEAVERDFAPAMYLEASLHERRGEAAVARDLLARARNSGGGTSPEKFHAAQMALAEGRWKEAAETYSELMELEKTDQSPYLGASVEIYLGCAIAQMELNEFDKARQNFVVAGALRPESIEPELFVGAALHAQGHRKEAEAVFDRLFRRHPTSEVTHMIIGRYWKGREAPSPGLEWTRLDFSDARWDSGPSGLGYGDGDDATVLDDMKDGYSSLYIRHVFEVPDPEAYERLVLSVKADDGFVASLNGKEVARSEVGAEVVVPHDALAKDVALEPLLPVEFFEPRSSLKIGRNVLAVQCLNAALDSSDFSLIPVLKAEIPRDAARGERLFGDFRRVAEGPGSEARIAYLDGRLSWRGGERERAVERFALAASRDPARPEPLLALAESLRSLGRPAEAERHLRDALENRMDDGDVWNAWAAVSLADLGRGPQEVLAGLPRREAAAEGDPIRCLEDLRWLLPKLENGEPVRINCGGERYERPGKIVWERDRFYRNGGPYMRGTATFVGEIQNTEDDPLYQTERYFPPSRFSWTGYRIPLPPGTYRVVLHFAEIVAKRTGIRIFDVWLEGKHILERYEPATAGYATAESKAFETAVTDGLLDVEFRPRKENPKISAIEIERTGR